MMISGVMQTIGGSMSQAFTAMYSIATSAISLYSMIGTAAAATPGGQVQAALIGASMITALIQLGAVQTGQADLARSVGGLNMALHGLGSMIISFSL